MLRLCPVVFKKVSLGKRQQPILETCECGYQTIGVIPTPMSL